MSLSDLQKKLEKESQGIMFPFSAKTPTVDTTQQVYNSATDGIMNMQGKKYVGPDSVIQYTPEGQRQLKEIEKGMLPQFDQEQFPDIGQGRVEDKGGTTPLPTPTPPVETEPEQPAFDPCPTGFKFDSELQRCVPIQKQSSDRDKQVVVDRPRNIGDTAQALGQVFNRKILEDQGITQDGTYQDDVTYTIDNNIPWLSLIPVIGTPLNIYQKNKADKQLQTLNNLDGVSVTKNKDGKNIVKVNNEYGKLSVQKALTNESLKGNLASTQKTNPDGSLMRDEFGRVQIAGPIGITTYGKTDTETYSKDKPKTYQEAFGTLNTGSIPIRQTGGDASVMEEVQRRQASTTTAAPTIGSQAASGADAQKGLMTDNRKFDTVSEPAGQQPDFLGQQQTKRQQRKKEEAIQKSKIGYGQNINQSIINANKKDSDREAQKQTGDSTMRAVTDRYGNPIRTTSGKVVTNPAPKSGGGSSSGSSKIVCTMMNESYGFGSFRNKIWLVYGSKLPKEYEIGYHTLFLPLVKYAKQKGFTNTLIKNVLEHIAIHRTVDIRKQKYNKVHVLGRTYRLILEPLCYITGRIKLWKKK